jgi:ATP-dependent Clp protease protease subunit
MKINKLLQLLQNNANTEKKSIRSEVQGDDYHVYVDGVIDSYWGASAADLNKSLLDANGKTVHLHINSPGGDVFEGRAMAAVVVGYSGRVVSHIEGLAASAATTFANAANEVRITAGSLFMIHNSWTFAMGDKSELRKTADLLGKIDGTIAADYQAKTGASNEQVVAWMDAETWFTAEEAKAAGFVDAIDPNTKNDGAQSKWNLSAYANAPQIAALVAEQEPDLSVQVAQQIQANKNRLRLFETS